jgi:hypothetical protein
MHKPKDAQHPVARFALVPAVLVGAALAGHIHAVLANDRDAREFFYLTNPDGPAGDWVAHIQRERVCAPGAVYVECRLDAPTNTVLARAGVID